MQATIKTLQQQVELLYSVVDFTNMDPMKLEIIKNMFSTSAKASCSEIKTVSSIDKDVQSEQTTPKSKNKRIKCEMEASSTPKSTGVDHCDIGKPEVAAKEKKCKLAVGNKKNIVAMGTMISGEGLLHGVPIGEGNARVAVVLAIKGKAKIPIPNKQADIFTVEDSIGTHVAWPRDLIAFPHDEKEKKHGSPPKKSDKAYKLSSSLNFLLKFARKMESGKTVIVPVQSQVFGYEFDAYIGREDLVDFCSMEPISNVCIMVYIRYLWSALQGKKEDQLYAFVNPNGISVGAGLLEVRVDALSKRLQSANPNGLVLAPFNTGNHWVLAGISIHRKIVHYFDPLNVKEVNAEVKKIIELALKKLKTKKGNKTFKKAISDGRWSSVPNNLEIQNVVFM